MNNIISDRALRKDLTFKEMSKHISDLVYKFNDDMYILEYKQHLKDEKRFAENILISKNERCHQK